MDSLILAILLFSIVAVSKTETTERSVTTTNNISETTITTPAITDSSCLSNDTTCIFMLDNSTVLPTNATLAKTKIKKDAVASTRILKELFAATNSRTCSCNLMLEYCDINCCCDRDCTFENKMVFSHCETDVNRYHDKNFCKYMEYIYKNNTAYEWEVNQNGLFCIVKSNLPAQYVVQEKQEIRSLEDSKLQMQNRHFWPNLTVGMGIVKFNSTNSFVHGKNLWVLKENRTERFALPSSLVTNDCIKIKEVKYLENLKVACIQRQIHENNEALKAGYYIKSVLFISSAQKWNVKQQCPKNVCMKPNVKICDENFENCASWNHSIPEYKISCRVSFSQNIKQCLFLTRKVKYDFYHNGTLGIKNVDIFLNLENITHSLSEENFGFLQEFQVNFFWHNYTVNNFSLRLSGNPGYQIGKYILMGNLIPSFLNITDKSNETRTEIKYKINRNAFDVKDNFLLFPNNVDGFCKLNNNTFAAVQFGVNAMFKCSMRGNISIESKKTSASNICKKIQQNIFQMWSLDLKNNTNVTRVVAHFGNSDVYSVSDWQEVIYEKHPLKIFNSTSGSFYENEITCYNIIRNLKINIFHSRVYTKEYENQEKIVGMSYNFGGAEKLRFDKEISSVLFKVSLQVDIMFFDMTKHKVKKFVDPPTFRIRLPYDFFYPFIKIDNESNSINSHLYILLTCTVFCIHF